MQVSLKIHSVVDVITNSSTVIYTNADESTIKSVKSLVDSLLKFAGSDKTAEELFDFCLYDVNMIERVCERLEEDEDEGYLNLDKEKSEALIAKFGTDLNYKVDGKLRLEFDKEKDYWNNKINQYILNNHQDIIEEYYDDSYSDNSLNVSLKEEFKDDKNLQIAQKVLDNLIRLFEINAERDG